MTSEQGSALPPGSSSGTPFNEACVAAVEAMSAEQTRVLNFDEDAQLSSALRLIIGTLPRLLVTRVGGEMFDAQDVAQEAMARFMRAVKTGQVSPELSPGGYLLTIAVNIIRDNRRRPPLPLPSTDFVLESNSENGDDLEAVASLLDGMASQRDVRRAIERANAAGDRMALEVVTAWLDLAARTSAAPSTREVASTLGIGKSSVANALRRFAKFAAVDDDS